MKNGHKVQEDCILLRKQFIISIMKNIPLLIISFVLLFTVSQPVSAQKNSGNKTTVSSGNETKQTVNEKVKIMTKELQLTESEQTQIRAIMNSYQQEKEKVKNQNLSKKEEKKKIEALKEIQKAKIKKVLGVKRFAKYAEMKKKDII